MTVRRIALASLVTMTLLAAGLLVAGCSAQVPDVRETTVAQARIALKAAGLKAGKLSYDEASEEPTGTVIDQDPVAGSDASAGTAVDLKVAGAAPVRVPGLGGLTQEAAVKALAQTGLKLGEAKSAFSDSIALGLVTSQSPRATAAAPRGSAVDVVLSIGPEPRVVPEVTQKTFTTAEKILAAAGFQVERVDVMNTDDVGTVVLQSPEAESRAIRGSVVTLNVSSGNSPPSPAEATVPDVRRVSLATAQSRLQAAGLRWKVFNGPGDGATARGAVYQQIPVSGVRVTAGTVVTIHVYAPSSAGAAGTGGSTGPKPVTVPYLKGATLAVAESRLQAVGLKWRVVTGPGDGATDPGNVYQQTPGSGVLVTAGTVVTIYTPQVPNANPGSPPAGPNPPSIVTVPYLKGATLAVAKSRLTAVSLGWTIVSGPGDGVTAAGSVYRQSPASGARISGGSIVTIYVWNGP